MSSPLNSFLRQMRSAPIHWVGLHLSNVLKEIIHDVVAKKFILKLPNDEAFIKYKPLNGTLNLFTIQVPKLYRRMGIGEALAQQALDYCADHNIKVVLTCPFLKTYYKLHPQAHLKKIIDESSPP